MPAYEIPRRSGICSLAERPSALGLGSIFLLTVLRIPKVDISKDAFTYTSWSVTDAKKLANAT